MGLVRKVRSRRVSETIAKRIKNQISAGRMLPGEKLPAEREMALRYHTSRVSVREAYRSLEELGLLTIRRGADGGAFIADIDHTPVMRSLSLMLRLGKTTHEEITQARLLIEPPIARLAARNATAEDVERLRQVLEQKVSALRRGGFRRCDMRFHRAVAECAGNLPLKLLMHSLADLTVQALASIEMSTGVQHQVCEAHREILDAIARHDEDTAHHLMLHHVAEVQQRVGSVLGREQGAERAASAAATVAADARVALSEAQYAHGDSAPQ
jgi:GntR family transcriptional regulator, transcriptional repressor for pyruvate dehydrogenase complex